MRWWLIFLVHLTNVIITVTGRRHILKLKNEGRHAILCSHFGYLEGGYFSVSIDQLEGDLSQITFSLDRNQEGGIAAYIERKNGNCFRGEPPRFLYLSFNPTEKFIEVHNKDIQLQGLVFEAGSKNLYEEDSQETVAPGTLTDAIQLTLDSLNLAPNKSAEFALRLNTLIESTPELQSPDAYKEQSSTYILLRKLARVKLAYDSPTIVPESTNETDIQLSSPTEEIKKDVVDSIKKILKTIYEITTPLGSLKIIPYTLTKGVVKAQFTVRFPQSNDAGLYNFYLHNCPSMTGRFSKRRQLNVTLSMVEKNTDSYLSAGQQTLPLFYFVMCCVYFLTSVCWFLYLSFSKNLKFRIHYLMFAVVLVKAISLAFHGINFYVIGKHGVHEEGWAVMYYITHIIRGALLFITILLIGAGWAFIKHMLTPRERNVFLIVIPLQILANVATVVIEESEAGTERYALWKDIFILVDLACCGAILFPVVWSIRHLKTASQTDGKAAINLRNLRLFRHFYILVICYVYFTRVIAYLLTITVPYSYSWVIELFKETVTFLFFVAVGYKFRPVDDNPYLLVPNDDEEDTVMERIQLEDVWSQSGFTDGVTRLTRSKADSKSKSRTTGTKPNSALLGRADADGEAGSEEDV